MSGLVTIASHDGHTLPRENRSQATKRESVTGEKKREHGKERNVQRVDGGSAQPKKRGGGFAPHLELKKEPRESRISNQEGGDGWKKRRAKDRSPWVRVCKRQAMAFHTRKLQAATVSREEGGSLPQTGTKKKPLALDFAEREGEGA